MVVCGYCRRVRWGNAWFEPPKPIVDRLRHPGGSVQVSHGACPDCTEAIEAQQPLDRPDPDFGR